MGHRELDGQLVGLPLDLVAVWTREGQLGMAPVQPGRGQKRARLPVRGGGQFVGQGNGCHVSRGRVIAAQAGGQPPLGLFYMIVHGHE